MRVMLTGATGFVGSHAAARLLEAGHEVRALVRDPAKLERVFAARGLAPPEAVPGDVTDVASVERAFAGCEAVVHCAAVVAMAAHRGREMLDTNTRGVENVVGGAARRGIPRIVHVSSASALFDPRGGVVTPAAPVVRGKDAYARSKSDAECAVRRLQEAGAPIRSVYPTGVIGPDDPGLSEANHALRTFVRDVVLLTSAGFQAVDVRDVAAVLARLALEGEGAARYVAGGPYLSWLELADAIDAVTGVRVRRVRVPGSLVRLGGHVCDAIKRVWDFDFPMTAEGMIYATRWQGADGSKTVEELGVRFRPPRETLADAIRWMVRAGHLEARFAGRLADGAA
jgi:dihydroflavonol-4-reductase